MPAWPMRVVDVLVPVALDQAYSYRVPAGLELAPGDVVAVPLGARDCIGVVWAENPNPQPAPAQPAEGCRRQSSTCRRSSRNCAASSTGSSNYTLASRGMVLRMALRMGEHLGPERERVGVRLAGPPPQRMTPARARVLALLADGLVARQRRGGAGSRRQRRRDRRPDRRRHARDRGAAARAGRRAARSGFRASRISRRRSCAAADALRTTVDQGGYTVDAARRRHRLGQDRSLFRGGGRDHPPRPADADPDAGDRAHRAVPRPLRAALRRARRRNGIRSFRRASVRAPGRRSPRTRCRSSSARARRCSCLTPISA